MPDEAIRTIGAAYDGSPPARLAASAAMHLAVRSGAPVELVVVGTGDVGADAAAASMSGAVDVEVRRLHGAASDALVDASRAYDVMLCGSHGRGRLMSAVLGSVSSRLVNSAHCPVLVVPPGVRHAAGAPLGLTTGAGLGHPVAR